MLMFFQYVLLLFITFDKKLLKSIVVVQDFSFIEVELNCLPQLQGRSYATVSPNNLYKLTQIHNISLYSLFWDFFGILRQL